jgi:hypothetical protein
LVPDAFVRSGVAFAWSGELLFRTTDAGDTFRGLRLPDHGRITSLVAGADDRLYLTMAGLPGGGLSGGLFVSRDWGTTWQRLGGDPALAGGATTVTPFAGTRLVAAPDQQAGGGLLCSEDDGATWSTRCS